MASQRTAAERTAQSMTQTRTPQKTQPTTSMTATLTKGARITGAARDELAARLKDRYERGESIRALAEDTGRSYGFVHRVLRDAQATLRGRGGATRGRGN